jgi:hypothetical protein
MNRYKVLAERGPVFHTGSLVAAVRWALGLPFGQRVQVLDISTGDTVTILGSGRK